MVICCHDMYTAHDDTDPTGIHNQTVILAQGLLLTVLIKMPCAKKRFGHARLMDQIY